MKESQNSTFKIAANLAITCFIAGAVIAGTYLVTSPVAAAKSKEMKNETMKKLVKDADKIEPIQGKEDWYQAEEGGKTVGYILPSESKGFGGTIKLLVAVTPDDKIIDFSILSHNETPGLGDNAAREPFRKQFWGKTAENLQVVKDPSDKVHIDAMTGATISSRAVTKAVKTAVDEVQKYLEGK